MPLTLSGFSWGRTSNGENISNMPRHSKEFTDFRSLTDRLLTVSKETVDKRIAAYNAEREEIPRSKRPGPNPKPKKGRV